jgi:hypothetical protein
VTVIPDDVTLHPLPLLTLHWPHVYPVLIPADIVT